MLELLVLIRAGEIKSVAAHFQIFAILTHISALRGGEVQIYKIQIRHVKTESRKQARLGHRRLREGPGSCGSVPWRKRQDCPEQLEPGRNPAMT